MKFQLTILDATLEEISEFLSVKRPSSFVAESPLINSYSASPVSKAEQQLSDAMCDKTEAVISPMPHMISPMPHMFSPMPETLSGIQAQIVNDDFSPVVSVAGATDVAISGTNLNALDITGLPWDERIHSANQGKNGDGSWRKRRGVPDAMVTEIENQLRARLVAAQQPMPTMTAQQPMPTIDFASFMGVVSRGMSTGKLNPDSLTYLAQEVSRETGKTFNSVTDFNGDNNALQIAAAIMQENGVWS